MSLGRKITPEALLAERDRLEELLHASEDWRALEQLRARAERGERLDDSAASGLEKVLLDALAGNPFYQRRLDVLQELEHNREAFSGDGFDIGRSPAAGGCDLKCIRGIDTELERRLHALGVLSFEQIARWEASDVRHVAATLGLGRQISAQNWIEQAALLIHASPAQSACVAVLAVAVTQNHEAAALASDAGPAHRTESYADDIGDAGPPPRPLEPMAYAITQEFDAERAKSPAVRDVAAEAVTAEPVLGTLPIEASAVAPQRTYAAAAAFTIPESAAITLIARIESELDAMAEAARQNAALWSADASREAMAAVLPSAGQFRDQVPYTPAPALAPPPERDSSAAKKFNDERRGGPQAGTSMTGYAAYYVNIEEASVEIIRHTDRAGAALALPQLTNPAPIQSLNGWLDTVRSAGPNSGKVGRILKALTGAP